MPASHRAEISLQEVFNRHGLTEHQRCCVAMILAGRAAAPLTCYPLCVRKAVVEITERSQPSPPATHTSI